MTDVQETGEPIHPGIKSAKKNLREFNRRLSLTRMENEEKILARRLKIYVEKDPERVILSIYDYLDRYYEIAKDLTACRNKCSFCCMIPAVISSAEAEIISKQKQIPIKQNPRYRIEPTAFASPCPLLKNGSCSVYQFRPMVCRTHQNYSDTNNACLPGADEPAMLTDRLKTFPHLMLLYEKIRINGKSSGDIRSFF